MSKFSDTHLAQLISEIPQTAFASSSKLAADKRKENNGSCKASCDIRERNKGTLLYKPKYYCKWKKR